MNKIVYCLTLALALISIISPVSAQISDDVGSEASALQELGLLEQNDGSEYELGGGVMNRETGIITLLRLFGLDREAEVMDDAAVESVLAKYSDANTISSWARNSVAYALEAGLVTGISENVFGPKTALSGKEYCSLILRQLGYVPNYDSAPADLAERGGLEVLDAVKFLDRELVADDLVGISFSALNARYSDGDTVIDKLVDEGVVNDEVVESLGLSNTIEPTEELRQDDFVVYGGRLTDNKLVYRIGNIGTGSRGDIVSSDELVTVEYQWVLGGIIKETYLSYVYTEDLPRPSEDLRTLYLDDRIALENHPEFWVGLEINSENDPGLERFLRARPGGSTEASKLIITFDSAEVVEEVLPDENNKYFIQPKPHPDIVLVGPSMMDKRIAFTIENHGELDANRYEDIRVSFDWQNPGETTPRGITKVIESVPFGSRIMAQFDSDTYPELKDFLAGYSYTKYGAPVVTITLGSFPDEINTNNNRGRVGMVFPDLKLREVSLEAASNTIRLSYAVNNIGSQASDPVKLSMEFVRAGEILSRHDFDLDSLSPGAEIRSTVTPVQINSLNGEATGVTVTVDKDRVGRELEDMRLDNVATIRLALPDLKISNLTFDGSKATYIVRNTGPINIPLDFTVELYWIDMHGNRIGMSRVPGYIGDNYVSGEKELVKPDGAVKLWAQVSTDYFEANRLNNEAEWLVDLPDILARNPSIVNNVVSFTLENIGTTTIVMVSPSVVPEWQDMYGRFISRGVVVPSDVLNRMIPGQYRNVLVTLDQFGSIPADAAKIKITFDSGSVESKISNNDVTVRLPEKDTEEKDADDAIRTDSEIAEAGLTGKDIGTSDSSVKPGSFWYGLKEMGRKITSVVTFGANKEAGLAMRRASTRLSEIASMIRIGDEKEVGSAMRKYLADVDRSIELTRSLREEDPVAFADLTARNMGDAVAQAIIIDLSSSQAKDVAVDLEKTKEKITKYIADMTSEIDPEKTAFVLSESVSREKESLRAMSLTKLLESLRVKVRSELVKDVIAKQLNRAREEISETIVSIPRNDKELALEYQASIKATNVGIKIEIPAEEEKSPVEEMTPQDTSSDITVDEPAQTTPVQTVNQDPNKDADAPTITPETPSVNSTQTESPGYQQSTAPVPASVKKVDLKIKDGSVSFSPKPLVSGKSVDFWATVENLGPDDMGVWKSYGVAIGSTDRSTMYLRIDYDNNGSWDALYKADMPPLHKDSSTAKKIFISKIGKAGNHKYQVCADGGEVVVETDEGNNCSEGYIDVK